MAAETKRKAIPQLSTEFQQAAKPLGDYIQNKVSSGIDKLQEQLDLIQKYPELNSAIDKLQEAFADGKGLEGLQDFIKTFMQDNSSAPANAPAVKSPAPSPMD